MFAPEEIAERTERIVTEFTDLEPRERLELLLEFAENLPALPSQYETQRAAGEHRVQECQTPVFIWIDVVDDRIQMHAWVAPEAPTVKGFVGIIREIYSGARLAEARKATPDLVTRLGLTEALGMMRMRGLSAATIYTRRLIEAAASDAR